MDPARHQIEEVGGISGAIVPITFERSRSPQDEIAKRIGDVVLQADCWEEPCWRVNLFVDLSHQRANGYVIAVRRDECSSTHQFTPMPSTRPWHHSGIGRQRRDQNLNLQRTFAPRSRGKKAVAQRSAYLDSLGRTRDFLPSMVRGRLQEARGLVLLPRQCPWPGKRLRYAERG